MKNFYPAKGNKCINPRRMIRSSENLVEKLLNHVITGS